MSFFGVIHSEMFPNPWRRWCAPWSVALYHLGARSDVRSRWRLYTSLASRACSMLDRMAAGFRPSASLICAALNSPLGLALSHATTRDATVPGCGV